MEYHSTTTTTVERYKKGATGYSFNPTKPQTANPPLSRPYMHGGSGNNSEAKAKKM